MNGLAVVAMADVLRHRFAGQLHLDDTAFTSSTGDGHQIHSPLLPCGLNVGTVLSASEEPAEKRRRLIRDADDLVRGLSIEFKIEFGSRPAVIPVGKMVELASPQWPLGEHGAPDREAHTWCLPGNAALLCDRCDGSHHAACEQAVPALILAREHVNCVAFGDEFAAVHRFLPGERERLG